MHRNILILSIMAVMAYAPVQRAMAEVSTELGVMELNDERQVAVTVDQNVVSVAGANGMTMEVVSLTGRHVASIKIESAAQRVELNLPKGCYIIKIGKLVRKVSIR